MKDEDLLKVALLPIEPKDRTETERKRTPIEFLKSNRSTQNAAQLHGPSDSLPQSLIVIEIDYLYDSLQSTESYR